LTGKKEITDKDFALKSAKVAIERNCTNVKVLDLRGKSPATNYFVIATGTSDRQGRSVADEICEYARESGFERFGKAGYEYGKWILLDFIDVIIHIFDAEHRDYYNLEMLWGDAEQLVIDK
jgi:ribosome-associated protein